MRLAAALASGVFVYFAVGLMFGVAPARRLRTPRPEPRQASARQLWLNQAGVRLTPAQFYLGSVAGGVVAFVLLAFVAPTPVMALLPAIALGSLPAVYFGRQRNSRLHEVQLAWPDALRELISAISAGMSLERALIELATIGPAPVREAFSRYPLLARMLGSGPALGIIKEELAHPTSDRVIEVLLLAQRGGGQTVTAVLEELIDATVDDLNTQEEIKTNALEGKLNARIVFALPWAVLLLLTLESGPYRAFYRSSAGLVVAVLALLWSLLGLWLVGRLSRPHREPRVFGVPSRIPEGW